MRCKYCGGYHYSNSCGMPQLRAEENKARAAKRLATIKARKEAALSKEQK